MLSMKHILSSLPVVAILAIIAPPVSLAARHSEAPAEPLEKRFELVRPTESEEAWRAVGWRTNLMEARELAQEQKRPLFLWIIVGNPHGCT